MSQKYHDSPPGLSSQKGYLAHFLLMITADADKIGATGYCVASQARAIPFHRVQTGSMMPRWLRPDRPTPEIEDFQLHRPC